MLSAAKSVLSAGPERLSASPGDHSLFLRQEDAAMRWFLLPSDHSQTTPPFQTRTYPPPPQVSPLEPRCIPNSKEGNIIGETAPDVHHPPSMAVSSNGPGSSDGDSVTPNSKANRVRFSSPPKTIFSPTVEVRGARLNFFCLSIFLCFSVCTRSLSYYGRIDLSVSQSFRPSVSPNVPLSINLSISPSACLPVCLVCLSVHFCVSPSDCSSMHLVCPSILSLSVSRPLMSTT